MICLKLPQQLLKKLSVMKKIIIAIAVTIALLILFIIVIRIFSINITGDGLAGMPRIYYDYSDSSFAGKTAFETIPIFSFALPKMIYLVMLLQVFLLKRKMKNRYFSLGFVLFVLLSLAATPAFLLITDLYQYFRSGLNPFFVIIILGCLLYQFLYWIYCQISFLPLNTDNDSRLK